MRVAVQNYFERFTGDKHEISITFGHISPVSNGHYEVRVDGDFYSSHDSRHHAYDEIEDIVKINNWSPLKPV